MEGWIPSYIVSYESLQQWKDWKEISLLFLPLPFPPLPFSTQTHHQCAWEIEHFFVVEVEWSRFELIFPYFFSCLPYVNLFLKKMKRTKPYKGLIIEVYICCLACRLTHLGVFPQIENRTLRNWSSLNNYIFWFICCSISWWSRFVVGSNLMLQRNLNPHGSSEILVQRSASSDKLHPTLSLFLWQSLNSVSHDYFYRDFYRQRSSNLRQRERFWV